MFYKTIIQGRLDFGTQKSYDKVAKMYQYRIDTYYRKDIIFNIEDIFFPDQLMMDIPRFVGQVSEKSFKNTCELLDYCSQFAINGTIRAWMVDLGVIQQYRLIEPESDKAAVQAFIKGRSLVRVEGKQDEAIAQLNKAIEKHDRHAQAYERRAKISLLMKKYADAKRDYSKALKIDPTIPTAYYGRAWCNMYDEKYEEAIKDLDQSIKKSVALEAIHWKSRRLKGNCHMKLGEYAKAIFELKLFCKRKFKPNDPNLQWKRQAWHNYGICLLEVEEYADALEAFNEASQLPDLNDGVHMKELLRNRGIAKQKSGKNGFIKDIKEAAKLGDQRATSLLSEIT